jgi:hypothetical protein
MPSKLSRVSYCALIVAFLVPAGCLTDRPKRDGQPLLKKPRIAADSVVLEVFAVHFRRDDHDLCGAIWKEVDEQVLPPDARHRLAENGFRAGVVSGHLPQAVQRILELHSQPTPQTDPDAPQVNVLTFDGRPTVRIQQMQLPARRRGEIATSNVYVSAAPLYYEDGRLHGETLEFCQGMLAVKPMPEKDGRIRLEVVPELHYGEPQRRFTSAEGILNLETGRPRKALAKLAQELMLSPGDIYVIGSSHAKHGSLGDYFFTVESGNTPHAKLLFVRLAHTQHDSLFAPPRANDNDEAAAQ